MGERTAIRAPLTALAAIIFALTVLSCAASAAGEAPASPPDKQKPEITPKVEKAIKLGCGWLVKNQLKDGSIGTSYPVASTSLGGMVWLAAGSTPSEGPYAANIKRALDYIMRSQARGGYITEPGGGNSSMYGHGFATQFLAQAYGMVRDETYGSKLRDALRRATSTIETSQNQYGGWNQTPDARAGDDGSGAVAIMQITALRASESSGIHVNHQVIVKSKKYLLDMTNNEGWYAYNWHSRGGGRQSMGTTAAGMYMLGALNLHEDPKYKKGIRNILDGCPFIKGRGSSGGNWGGGWEYYTWFYATMAVYQYGGDDWRKWYAGLSEELTRRQHPDGGFDDPYGGVFNSMAILCLQLPYRYLPMFQEGGPGMEGK